MLSVSRRILQNVRLVEILVAQNTYTLFMEMQRFLRRLTMKKFVQLYMDILLPFFGVLTVIQLLNFFTKETITMTSRVPRHLDLQVTIRMLFQLSSAITPVRLVGFMEKFPSHGEMISNIDTLMVMMILQTLDLRKCTHGLLAHTRMQLPTAILMKVTLV